jgi:hypothetical protein
VRRGAALIDRSGRSRTFSIAQSPGDDLPAEDSDRAASDRPDSDRPGRSTLRLELVEDLLAAAPDESRIVLALMPTRSKRRSSHPSFVVKAGRLTRAAGAEMWNLRDAVPDREFETAAHFAATGHQRFSEILAERLDR